MLILGLKGMTHQYVNSTSQAIRGSTALTVTVKCRGLNAISTRNIKIIVKVITRDVPL